MQISLSNIRVLCTGNPNYEGIAKQVVTAFPNTKCISRSVGIDLLTQEGLDYFESIIPTYDVFINISRIPNRTQEKLLRIAHTAGMKGHVFNIGSTSEYKRWEWYDADYTDEKRQLRETSLDLCTEFFKTTHIVVGGFRDYENDSNDRMDAAEIVKMIQYILESPINIPIVGIEKIIDNETQEHLNAKLQNTQ